MSTRISACGYCRKTEFTAWYSKSAPRDSYGRLDRDYLDSEPVAYCSEEHRDAADALRAEVVAEFEAYPGELAMLRGVLGVVRSIARHGDLGDTEGGRELRQVITEHYADERAAYAEQGEKDTAPAATSTPQPAELTIYRAAYAHDQIPLGLYTTQEAARAHCEAEARLGQPDDVEVTFDWIGDEGDPEEAWELVAEFGGQEQPTDYVVYPITVPSEYDPEADE